jgi:hypothetical protein
MPYKISEDTFCLYCQKEFHTPKKLQNHIAKKHPNTYAAYSIEDELANTVMKKGKK